MNTHHDPEHRWVWDQIPWVVAGSASGVDQLRVQQHLLHCEDCRDELIFHQALRQGMQAPPQVADAIADTGLQQLWARIDSAPTQPAPTAEVSPALPPGLLRQRWLVAAVLVQSLGLAALSGLLWHGSAEAPYQTFSNAPTTRSAAVLHLVPAPTLAMGPLAALLSRHGLQVVESSHDGTVLGVAWWPTPLPAITVQELAARLRAEPGVLLAEPIVSNPPNPRP
jgi:hypothetical protein